MTNAPEDVQKIITYVKEDHGLYQNIQAYRQARRALKEWHFEQNLQKPAHREGIRSTQPIASPSQHKKSFEEQVSDFKSKRDYAGLADFLLQERPENANQLAKTIVHELMPDTELTREYLQREDQVTVLKQIHEIERKLDEQSGREISTFRGKIEEDTQVSENKKIFLRTFKAGDESFKNVQLLVRLKEADSDFDQLVQDFDGRQITEVFRQKYPQSLINNYVSPFLLYRNECLERRQRVNALLQHPFQIDVKRYTDAYERNIKDDLPKLIDRNLVDKLAQLEANILSTYRSELVRELEDYKGWFGKDSAFDEWQQQMEQLTQKDPATFEDLKQMDELVAKIKKEFGNKKEVLFRALEGEECVQIRDNVESALRNHNYAYIVEAERRFVQEVGGQRQQTIQRLAIPNSQNFAVLKQEQQRIKGLRQLTLQDVEQMSGVLALYQKLMEKRGDALADKLQRFSEPVSLANVQRFQSEVKRRLQAARRLDGEARHQQMQQLEKYIIDNFSPILRNELRDIQSGTGQKEIWDDLLQQRQELLGKQTYTLGDVDRMLGLMELYIDLQRRG
ncbi:MAG: hypothetical protein KDK65_01910 [Chlamydiia bacterium]|nr:hypothetical protein [Chlamydiia bacterium]